MENTRRMICDEVIKEWEQAGGLLNCYGEEIFIEDESVYLEWLKEEGLEDTVENQKLYCRLALEYCNEYSAEEIDEILNNCEW